MIVTIIVIVMIVVWKMVGVNFISGDQLGLKQWLLIIEKLSED